MKIFSESKPIEMFMGSNTENAIDTPFNAILNRIQQAMKHQMKEEVDLPMIVLDYSIIIFKEYTLEEVNHI